MHGRAVDLCRLGVEVDDEVVDRKWTEPWAHYLRLVICACQSASSRQAWDDSGVPEKHV